MTTNTINLRCPKCGAWLTETNGYARVACCGWVVAVWTQDEWRKTQGENKELTNKR